MLPDRADEARQDVDGQVRDVADAKRRTRAPAAPRLRDGPVERRQDLRRLLRESAPGVGRNDPAARSLQERRSDRDLEATDGP